MKGVFWYSRGILTISSSPKQSRSSSLAVFFELIPVKAHHYQYGIFITYFFLHFVGYNLLLLKEYGCYLQSLSHCLPHVECFFYYWDEFDQLLEFELYHQHNLLAVF